MVKKRFVLISVLSILLIGITSPLLVVASSDNDLGVVIDYSQSLREMISEGGYRFIHRNINPRNFPIDFPINCKKLIVNINIELVYFGNDESYDSIIRELEAKNMRSATLPELLAFGAIYPEKEDEYPIIALGSIWHDSGNAPYAVELSLANTRGTYVGRERGLDLFPLNSLWLGRRNFAAVRK